MEKLKLLKKLIKRRLIRENNYIILLIKFKKIIKCVLKINYFFV